MKLNKEAILENAGILGRSLNMKKNPPDNGPTVTSSVPPVEKRDHHIPGTQLESQKSFSESPTTSNFTKSAGLRALNKG